MRLSEITIDAGTLEEIACWGLNPMQVLLDLLDETVEQHLDEMEEPGKKVLYIKYMLENYLTEIRELMARFDKEYIMKRRKEEIS